jgi:hypothetical protein
MTASVTRWALEACGHKFKTLVSFSDPLHQPPCTKAVTTGDEARTHYSSKFTAGLDGADGLGGSR